MAQAVTIEQNTLRGWKTYNRKFGFVPDPMVLRTAELYLNGVRPVCLLYQSRLELDSVHQG